MVLKVTVSGAQQTADALKKAIADFLPDESVTVGIHEDAGNHESDEITNAQLGAILHFGSDINHPGGTPFGFATEADAQAGRVRFLKKGQGFAVLGVTEPHKIKIPPRPWLDVGVQTKQREYIEILQDTIENGGTMHEALEKIGVVAVAAAQVYMTELRSPPNAPSTIRRKGSDNPLKDTGALIQSVTFKITTGAVQEGIE